jgi:hypothetical protein
VLWLCIDSWWGVPRTKLITKLGAYRSDVTIWLTVARVLQAVQPQNQATQRNTVCLVIVLHCIAFYPIVSTHTALHMGPNIHIPLIHIATLPWLCMDTAWPFKYSVTSLYIPQN